MRNGERQLVPTVKDTVDETALLQTEPKGKGAFQSARSQINLKITECKGELFLS